LELRVAEGDFREDLLFRLAVSRIHVPPLRDRIEDLEELVFHFVRTFSARYETPVLGVSGDAFERLREHDWPGNIRELRNVVDRAVLLARGGWIRAEDLQIGDEAPRLSPTGTPRKEKGYPPTTPMDEVERDHIARVLAYASGGIARSAELLGIHRNTLSRKIKRYGLETGPETAGEGEPR
jgi:DNA-binding NtrC family response regulator